MRIGLGVGFRWRRFAVIFLAVLVFVLLGEVIRRLEINFLSSAEQYVCIQATQIIDKCIAQEFEKTNSDMLQHFDENSVITDTVAINRLRSQVISSVQNALEAELDGTVYVPIGTIFGPSLFHSYGPDVPVSIRPGGYVTSEIDEDYKSCGINQVKYSMYMTVTVEVRYTGLFLQSVAYINTRAPIIENISIGSVPDYYGDMGILD